ncbi:hypothetical protein JTE90_025496 [Oedothorax gibbosus]|uniref:Uncharacterized protein n=1 Tax=Oedothorax gibbosus TaxID=931172 RepID=A0AAV6UY19_9ARAC|nr:hypothetical protein JTE90_025496 [Oedothorax gibbosus]
MRAHWMNAIQRFQGPYSGLIMMRVFQEVYHLQSITKRQHIYSQHRTKLRQILSGRSERGHAVFDSDEHRDRIKRDLRCLGTSELVTERVGRSEFND